ncbi:MAG TPA: SDR family NAD(P)-dependent oxidoreductase [Bacteroidia bacterium]|nr:SDR family NAD(P)-dependent oxidoreductase [Bacteroidia bacterium]HNS12747.1 SDR family NAD(P)-dependent oxidoreductase [Bacteroidia bacterium]
MSNIILVTGGTGLVGAQLIFDLVRDGRHIRALKRSDSKLRVIERTFREHPGLLSKIEWVQGDVTDLYSIMDAMEGVSEVYHSAGLISFRASEFEKMMKVNAQGTANMVNIALEKGIKKFCHISSVAALGRVEEGVVIDEDAVWKTSKSNSNYAISKYSAEREVWRAAEEGLNVVIVNPSIILGAGDLNSGSSKLFRQVKNGLRFYAEGRTGFVDVRDVSRSCIALMDNNIFGRRFVLNSENLSYKELLSSIAEGFNMNPPSFKAEKWMSELVWRLEAIRSFFSGSNPLISKETSRNSRKKWNYSSEKIRKVLGSSFIPVRQSVMDTCRIYLAEEIKK